MLPTAITLRNYRSFVQPTRLDLRPVTLLFGVNNAGKSALLRVLPLLGDSVGPDSPGPLNLESRSLRGGGFHDLRWKGQPDEDSDPDLGLTLHWQDANGPQEIDFSWTWFDDGPRLVTRRLVIREGGNDLLRAEWTPVREERSTFFLSYRTQTNETHRIGFRGLLPESDDPGLDEILGVARRRLRGLRDQIQWLGATRRLPEVRHAPRPSGPRWRLRPSGEDAGAILASQHEVLTDVSGWYERNVGRRLEVLDVPPGSYRLVLQNLKESTFGVDLLDTGEAMAQVLPVLTALALSRLSGGPSVLALEEPESHLNPAQQRALAEDLCSLAAGSPRPYVVLETHSEHLLLGAQLEIVRGRLNPEDVLVYWIRQLDNGESVAEQIRFDRDARPQGASLPPGVFAHDTEVAREIVRVRMERQRS